MQTPLLHILYLAYPAPLSCIIIFIYSYCNYGLNQMTLLLCVTSSSNHIWNDLFPSINPLFLFLFIQIHIFLFLSPLSVFLLCQILSATWTSPSLTWTWTVFLTCPTSPPSGTQWRCLNRPTTERSRRKSLRAQCYDATESSPPPHTFTLIKLLLQPLTHSSTFHLCSWRNTHLKEITTVLSGGRLIRHIFILSFNLIFYFFLPYFTCNIAFNVTHETGNRLLGGTSALCCFS